MIASKDKRPRRGSVRIIGGRWRRRLIPLPQDDGLRPTPDRVRETLFNWLDPQIAGACCLDLFAGSGVLGLEALSRGARHTVFVESDGARARALERLCERLDADAEVFHGSADDYLELGVGAFDVVFVDPPYLEPVGDLLERLAQGLKPGARIYVERARTDEWPDVESLEWRRRSSAGAVAFGLAECVR